MLQQPLGKFLDTRKILLSLTLPTLSQVVGEDKRITQTSQEILTEFHDIAIQYRDAVVKGRGFSESGAKVAEEYVDRMAAQTTSESDLEELTKHLPSRLDSLLNEAKVMSKKLNAVSRSLERVRCMFRRPPAIFSHNLSSSTRNSRRSTAAFKFLVQRRRR